MPTIIVCLKYAVDVAQIKVDPSTRKLITTDAPRKISDFDKNALEEAIRIKEKFGGEVIALTASAEDASSALREALAMGADRAFLIKDSSLQNSDSLITSHVLAKAIRKIGSFDLIICGEASIDSYSAQVGPRLAENLGIPVVTYVRKLSLENDVLVAERSLEDQSEVVKVKTPALVTVTKEINVPRVSTLMDVIKASKKELVTWSLSDLGVSSDEVGVAVEILGISAPKIERKKVKIEGETPEEIAEKLVKALIQEGVIGG
ncbi:electron transfer flavoprotein subunit beta/FixA family protein [Candidatus Bathyarchaeota archaeon]|nr:electron transfer flavoprotein subunit beta/FixA family protein [Candidatus Bathyarchaeota archaeon]